MPTVPRIISWRRTDSRSAIKSNAAPTADIKPGNALPLKNIPLGTVRPCDRDEAGGGRTVGAWCGYAGAVDGERGQVRSAQTAFRRAADGAGRMSCDDRPGRQSRSREYLHRQGRTQAMAGKRPHVRGVAMNPVDHPHGGGEGRSKGNHPQSPWGMPAKGYKTRGKKTSDRFIVSGRPRGKAGLENSDGEVVEKRSLRRYPSAEKSGSGDRRLATSGLFAPGRAGR